MKPTISEAQMKMTLAVLIATCILVGILHGQSNEQATKPSGQLELRVAQTKVTKDQPFVLELRLRNTGTRPFYAVGNINYAVARLYGDYTIQVRTVGSDWKSLKIRKTNAGGRVSMSHTWRSPPGRLAGGYKLEARRKR